jgi:hypothetical protein
VKPVDGFSLTKVTGTCKKAIALSNMKRVELKDIEVEGYGGELVTKVNVEETLNIKLQTSKEAPNSSR